MRIQFQRDFGSFGRKGQWLDLAPDEAALLITSGIARSDSGITDRAILDRAGRPDADPLSPGKSFGDFVRAVLRNDRFYLEKHYGSTLRVPDTSPLSPRGRGPAGRGTPSPLAG